MECGVTVRLGDASVEEEGWSDGWAAETDGVRKGDTGWVRGRRDRSQIASRSLRICVAPSGVRCVWGAGTLLVIAKTDARSSWCWPFIGNPGMAIGWAAAIRLLACAALTASSADRFRGVAA